MKKEFFIVNTKQFSYHTDTFKYCENLKINSAGAGLTDND